MIKKQEPLFLEVIELIIDKFTYFHFIVFYFEYKTNLVFVGIT